MKCKVCGKPIDKHNDNQIMECLNNPAALGTFRQVLAWAIDEGFLVDRGSDGGFVWFQFHGEPDVVRTKQPERELWKHYLTKVVRVTRKKSDDPEIVSLELEIEDDEP